MPDDSHWVIDKILNARIKNDENNIEYNVDWTQEDKDGIETKFETDWVSSKDMSEGELIHQYLIDWVKKAISTNFEKL